MFQNGFKKDVYNVTNVHMYVLMHVLDHFYQQKMNCKMHQNAFKNNRC